MKQDLSMPNFQTLDLIVYSDSLTLPHVSLPYFTDDVIRSCQGLYIKRLVESHSKVLSRKKNSPSTYLRPPFF